MDASEFLEAILGLDSTTLMQRAGGVGVKKVLSGRDLFDGKSPYSDVMGKKSIKEHAFSIPEVGELAGLPNEAAAYASALRNFKV